MRRAAAYLALCRFGTPAVLFVFGYNLCSYLGCVKKYGRLADRILKMKEKTLSLHISMETSIDVGVGFICFWGYSTASGYFWGN